jgi:hypothetical protein
MHHRLSIVLARVTAVIGRTGWAGLVLCAAAVAWWVQGWRAHVADEAVARPQTQAVAAGAASEPVAALPLPAATLARQDDQALLLTQVQQIAVTQGLGWASADYKLVPAGEAVPMSLEVRCVLKGPYPRLRAALAQWLSQVPGLALRDLSMTRPSSEAAEGEARLQLVIFLRSDAPEVKP